MTVIYSILHTWMRQMIIHCTYETFLLFSRCVRGCGGKVGGGQILTLQTQCKSCETHTWSLFACDPLCSTEISLPQSLRNDTIFSFSVNGSFVSQQVVYTGRESLINPKSRWFTGYKVIILYLSCFLQWMLRLFLCSRICLFVTVSQVIYMIFLPIHPYNWVINRCKWFFHENLMRT